MAETQKELMSAVIHVPVSASLKAIVIELAAEHGTTPAQYIRWIVTNFIKGQEKHLKIEE
jgi:hypothetical protein